ncbi:MAG: ISKra4 family transposase [Blastocatellia bacterium]|nr:ISKra4 family transposase [Blastocatellia bacterium]
MKASISANAKTNEMNIKIQDVDVKAFEQGNFHARELIVRELVNLVGGELTADMMRRQDVDEEQLLLDGKTYYRKEASTGHYQTLYGEQLVERHLYQTSAGGETICPMEINCQLNFGSATPLLAEIASFKLAVMTGGEVERDMAKSHGLKLSDNYLREIALQVGQIGVESRIKWQIPAPEVSEPVEIIAIGVDGTTMPLVGEDYKEAMCGTVAFYDDAGERMTTEYHGAMPQAGKKDFAENFAARALQVLMLFPNAVHVCLGDGAKWNWEFFGKHFPVAIWILDFFHATLHLHKAAELIFGAGHQAEAYYEEWRAKLKEEVGAASGLLRSLVRYQKQGGLTAKIRDKLNKEIEYFRNNLELMNYAEFLAAGLPIGSGVTEAGCKELIKARFCRSGMRWKRETGAPILQLRAIRLSNQWDSFWANVMLRAT